MVRIRQRTIERQEDPGRRWRRAGPVIGLLLLLTIVAGACNEIPAEPIRFDNQSDQIIVITVTDEQGQFVYKEILPGRTVTDPSVCVDPDLEARLESGALVAFRAGPFCQGDPVWAITRAEVDAAE